MAKEQAYAKDRAHRDPIMDEEFDSEEKFNSLRDIMSKFGMPGMGTAPTPEAPTPEASPPAVGQPAEALDPARTVEDSGATSEANRHIAAAESDDPAKLETVALDKLRPNRFQPRRDFDESEIRELADSMHDLGILQPLVARRIPGDDGSFEIVTGERRWRAAKLAGLREVPVVLREFSDGEALEAALVENLHRKDLGPLEEAESYKRLIDEFGHSQDKVAKAVGKSRSHIANTLRLLNLPDPVKGMVDGGVLSAGHGRALLAASDPTALATEVETRQLNVRETEALVRENAPEDRASRAPAANGPDIEAIERRLAECLGLKVRVRHRGPGGRIEIAYRDRDQLDAFLRRVDAPAEACAPWSGIPVANRLP